jgi:drug/metabolite transporter (DMT)-like permease
MTSARAGSRLAAWVCLFVVYVVWGTTYLAIRVVVLEMPPFAAAATRFLTASIALGLLAFLFERAQGWPTRRQWIDYGVVGLLFLAGGNAAVMWSETRVGSGIAALMVATTPLWLTFLDGLRAGGERWTVRVWLGVLLGLAGVALIARPEGDAGRGHWSGIAALVAGALVWSFGALYVKTVTRKLGTFSATGVEMLAGGVGLLLESRLAGEDLSRMALASTHAWLGLLYLIVFGAILGFTAFAYAIHELPANTVGTYAYVNPVVAVFLGHLLLKEPLSSGILGGAALIVIGVVIVTTRKPASPSIHDATETQRAQRDTET